MNEDMSEIFKKMNEMLKNDEVPDSVKSLLNSLSSNANDISSKEFSREGTTSENSEQNFSNFDLDTMLKMKAIIENMNKGQNDPRANLLKSLKPYLKQSRKNKVDQYIKLFSMGKAFEILNPLGGEKKNDV
jgi:hypothetical protein